MRAANSFTHIPRIAPAQSVSCGDNFLMYRTGTYRYFYPLLPRTPPRAKVMNFGLDFHRSLVSSLRSGRFLSFRALSSKQRRNAPGMSKKLSQFSSPSRAFGKGKETAASKAISCLVSGSFHEQRLIIEPNIIK